jgi:uncharacterized protein (DUF169 family)
VFQRCKDGRRLSGTTEEAAAVNPEEEIAYQLAYFGDHDATHEAIVSVIARLPAEVRAFALERSKAIATM